MELQEIESRLKFVFPARHRQALLDLGDRIHEACEFLVLSDSDDRHNSILSENEWIHSSDFDNPWPEFLIAFASNGCGDYFAYDTQQNPASIIYIDPDISVEENLQASDKLCFETFVDWYKDQIETHKKVRQKLI